MQLDVSVFDTRDSSEEAAEGSVSAGSNLQKLKHQSFDFGANILV